MILAYPPSVSSVWRHGKVAKGRRTQQLELGRRWAQTYGTKCGVHCGMHFSATPSPVPSPFPPVSHPPCEADTAQNAKKSTLPPPLGGYTGAMRTKYGTRLERRTLAWRQIVGGTTDSPGCPSDSTSGRPPQKGRDGGGGGGNGSLFRGTAFVDNPVQHVAWGLRAGERRL